MSPSLELLYLSDIPTLVELPSSFHNLHRLERLHITKCVNLETFTTGINLQSLWELDLSGCSRLRTFPDISTLTNIIVLNLSKTGIEEIPQWIEKFSSLEILDMKGCINLETLPTGINLRSLRTLDLSGCSRLRTFPDISTNITQLDISETVIEEVPCWIEKFSKLQWLQMKGCNKLEYVNLNISKLTRLEEVDFSDCFNLDQEALFQHRTYFGCKLKLSGEEVPSYFTHRSTTGTFASFLIVPPLPSWTIGTIPLPLITHRTTGSSCSLTIPLLPSSLSHPSLRFRACVLFNCDNNIYVKFRFTGRFWNCSDSYHQEQDFCADTKGYEICSYEEDSGLIILDCEMSRIPQEMNSDRLDLKIHIVNSAHTKIKEWGVRILEDCSSADNRLGNPNTPPHLF